MKRRHWFVAGHEAAWFSTALLLAVPAAAQEVRARTLEWLEWEAPPGCPERAAVYERTRTAAGFAPELGRFERVRGVIVAEQNAYRLTLEFFEARAQRMRSIEAQTCGDLEGAAAVAIALALGNEPAPQSTSGADAEVRDVPAQPEAEAAAKPAQLGWSGSVGGLLDLASVSQASAGVEASARLHWAPLELGLRGLWLPDSRRDVGAGESVQFGLAAAGPLACWRWELPLAPAACASFEWGRLSADGSGLSRNERSFSALWLAPSLALELRQAFARSWSVELRMEALRPLSREHYTVNGDLPVYDSPEVVLRWALGLAWAVDGR